jgi:competence protein ComEC
LWETKARLVDEVWKISSVSIAAQIATLPISLYYFHKFPNYFLPANLVIIPVSFVVLVGGLAVITLSFIEPVAVALGWILTWVVKVMNFMVVGFGQLPGSVTEGIYLSPVQCLLLCGLIASIALLFIQKRFLWLPVSLLMAIGFSGSRLQHFASDVDIGVVHVFGVPGHSVINWTGQGKMSMVADSSANAGMEKISRYLEPSLIKAGAVFESAEVNKNVAVSNGCAAWLLGGISFLQVVSRDHLIPAAEVSFVIVSNNSISGLTDLQQVKCDKIIVDSSNSFYFAERLRNEAIAKGTQLWSVPHDGAFEYKHAIR